MTTHFLAPFFGSNSSSGCSDNCRVVSSFSSSSNSSVTLVPFLADVSMYLHFHIDWNQRRRASIRIGTSQNSPGLTWASRVSLCLSLSLSVSPCLSLSLPVSPCLSLSLSVSLCYVWLDHQFLTQCLVGELLLQFHLSHHLDVNQQCVRCIFLFTFWSSRN